MAGKFYDGHMWVHQVEDLPQQTHLAVLVNKSISYTQNWGRGDETSTDNHFEYIVFETQENLEKWILAQDKNRQYKVISCRPIDVEMKVHIKLDI